MISDIVVLRVLIPRVSTFDNIPFTKIGVPEEML